MMSGKLSECLIELPEYLNKNLMFNRRVQIGHNECFNIVLTRGPKIYVTKYKQVIAFCDLISTVVKHIECKQSDFALESSKLFNFDICFSYAGKEKHIFLLLKMRDKFIVMSIRNDHITVHKQYENVNLFKVEERYSVVHIRIEMMDGQSVCEDLYRLTTATPMLDQDRFGGVGKTIADRIALVKAEISTTKLDVQKYFHTLAKELRFGPPTLHDVINGFLFRFGLFYLIF